MEYIELRTDVMARMTQEMRDSFMTSSYGDWSFGEDPTVKELEAYAAEMFGVEDTAYVLTATFGNLCALFTAGQPGEELIARDGSHLIKHQNGCAAKLSRMMTRTVDCPEGYMTPQVLKQHLRKSRGDGAPKTSVLLMEYPSFEGSIPPLQKFQECGRMAKAEGIHIHVDGARLFVALSESKVEPKQLIKSCSSLIFCLTKCLLAPIGSIVVGSKPFIDNFKLNRKVLGGQLRKPGLFAGTGLIALKKMRLEIGREHEIAVLLGKRLNELGWIEVAREIETDMVICKITDPTVNPNQLGEYLKQNGVMIWSSMRFVVHHHIQEPQVEKFIELMKKWKSEQSK